MEHLLENIENYIKYMKNRGYAFNTIKNYEINLRYFYSFCNHKKIDYINIKGSEMIAYVNSMKKYKPSTINLRLSSLKGFYEYLINIDLVSKNPVRKSLYIRKDRKKPKPLTLRQEQLFKEFINSKPEHIKVAFNVLLESGIRISELTRLEKDDFIEINDKYYIRILESKNNNNRIVPISEKLYKNILEYIENNIFFGPVFNQSTRGYQYHADYFAKNHNIDFSIHSLRHTYATRQAQKGYPVQIIQKLLGHKSISTTMYYIEITDIDILNL